MAYWGNGRRATYLYINCMKSKHTDWNINIPFIIHVDFDHVWAEHYPVALNSVRRSASMKYFFDNCHDTVHGWYHLSELLITPVNY